MKAHYFINRKYVGYVNTDVEASVDRAPKGITDYYSGADISSQIWHVIQDDVFKTVFNCMVYNHEVVISLEVDQASAILLLIGQILTDSYLFEIICNEPKEDEEAQQLIDKLLRKEFTEEGAEEIRNLINQYYSAAG